MTKTDGRRRSYEEQNEGAPGKIQRPADQGCYCHTCEPERFSGCPMHVTSLSIGYVLIEHPGRSEGALRSSQCSIDGIKAFCRFRSDGLCETHRHCPLLADFCRSTNPSLRPDLKCITIVLYKQVCTLAWLAGVR